MGKPTVHDIAKEAGVSLATVDRVLNARPGVREKTVERVQDAVARLGYVRDTYAANLARQRRYRFVFMLPDWQGQFVLGLRRAIEEGSRGALGDRTDVELRLVPSRDHTALVSSLADLDPSRIDGLAIMANETPVVRDAIARLKAHGVAVVSLVADQPNSERDHFVGIDNIAAGRTAGRLLGRFAGARQGPVAVFVTSVQARDMAERRLGFDQVIGAEFPNLNSLPSIEVHDDPDLAERLAADCLARNPDLVGVYSAGANIERIMRALSEKGSGARPVCIDHELTDQSRALLEEGGIDAVISQNAGHLARSALRVLRAKCDGAEVIPSQEHIRIDIILKENLPPRTVSVAGADERGKP
jgi:LacI family transcriptional regulator